MHFLLKLALLILSVKVLDGTIERKSGVCDRTLAPTSQNELNDDIESLLISRTHNLSLGVSGENNTTATTLLVIINELDLQHQHAQHNASTTTTAVDDTDQGSAKSMFNVDDSNQESATTNDTTMMIEYGKLLQ